MSFLNSLQYDCLFFVDFPHDPYSDKNACNSICCRGDLLNPSDRRPSGCYDTKVRSRCYTLANVFFFFFNINFCLVEGEC